MSRTPQSRKAETHARIVEAAAKAIRLRGYAGVGVAEVMKDAGLTHGGFYAHFDSRDALLVAALEHAGRDSAARVSEAAARHALRGHSAFHSLVNAYLADELLKSMDAGCPVAALGSDMPRQSEPVREASMLRVQRLIAAVRKTLPPASQAMASVIAGTLVGTLQLARALGDNDEGRTVLAATRQALIEQHDSAAPAAG
jgi:TetR/AcrR family transcriptional repressor of nem operon